MSYRLSKLFNKAIYRLIRLLDFQMQINIYYFLFSYIILKNNFVFAWNIGEKQFKCDLCSSAFIRKHELILHKRFHTGFCFVFGTTISLKLILQILCEKPFKCNMCSRDFSHKSHLTLHARIHTGFFIISNKELLKYTKKT